MMKLHNKVPGVRSSMTASRRRLGWSVAHVTRLGWLLIVLAGVPAQASPAADVVVHVARTGDDRAAGTSAAPLATPQRALERSVEIAASTPDAGIRIQLQWLKAITTHRVGLAEYHSDGKSLTRILESVELLTPIVARSIHDPYKVGELAATHDFLAQALSGANDADRAFDHEMKAQGGRVQAALQKPNNAEERMNDGVGYVRIAATADTQSRSSFAFKAYQEALAFFEREDNKSLLQSNAEYHTLMQQRPAVMNEFDEAPVP
jgi:hypothetical protein